jgi:chromate reductase
MKRIAALVGSIRAQSLNQKLYNAALELAPKETQISQYSIADIPLYNEDNDSEQKQPFIAALRKAINEAHALLIVTPEYNRSIPGLLKNALDWVSTGDYSYIDKPVLIMGATNGSLGTANSQSDLKKVLLHMGMHVLGQPEVYVSQADKKFDEQGNLIDEKTKSVVTKALAALVAKT